ncbi:GerAB/ArcD/ProY family transporter [Bacillus sp. 7884-1]|uniref:GerAB/ArcD/ProY family transporter n=1 Tax=Bacillus sp. 7884-1 TaxID=2021693 RepID=UPI000BA53973|nr:endospore germination permease [Bacillus sp. 7884-1]PAE39396.1 spore gernimation protein [Bacillus sp. 7884-1]
MKKYAFQEITFMQYIFLIHGTQVGIGFLSLPGRLAEESGTDGWMSILIGWIFSIIASLIIIQLMKKHPDKNVVDLLQRYFGKWLGSLGTILLTLYLAFMAFAIIHRTALYVNSWVLHQTPSYILLILFTIPSYLIIHGGVRNIARYAELVFLMSIWMYLVYLIPLKDSHWINLLPLFKEGLQPLLLSIKTTVFSFLGFEITLFLYPYLKKKQLASIGIIIANTLSMLVYLYITIICFAFFSPDEITKFFEPTLYILRIIEFKFVERVDIIVMSFYIIVISKVWIPYMLFTVMSTSQILNNQDYKKLLFLLLVLFVLVTGIINPSFNANTSLMKILEKFGFIIAFVFPICFWFYMSVSDRIFRRENI